MKRSSGVPLRSPCEEPGLQLSWPACHGHNLLCISSHLVNDLRKTDTYIAALGLHRSWQDGRKAWERSRHESFMVFTRMLADCARATAPPRVSFHPEGAHSFTSPTVLCLGCQGLPHLQWMLSLVIAQLGCAGTSHETNTSSYIQGCSERGRMKAQIKLLFAS